MTDLEAKRLAAQATTQSLWDQSLPDSKEKTMALETLALAFRWADLAVLKAKNGKESA